MKSLNYCPNWTNFGTLGKWVKHLENKHPNWPIVKRFATPHQNATSPRMASWPSLRFSSVHYIRPFISLPRCIVHSISVPNTSLRVVWHDLNQPAATDIYRRLLGYFVVLPDSLCRLLELFLDSSILTHFSSVFPKSLYTNLGIRHQAG